MFSTPGLCSYAAVVVWAWAGVAAGSYDAGSYDEFMSCGSARGGGSDRDSRNFRYRPEIDCDLSKNGFCETAGSQYPWQSVKRFVYENQGLMKRMYGDQRHINVLRSELMDNFYDDMGSPDVYKYQPHLSEPPPENSLRHNRKIKRNGREGARAMEVTMEPVINKNVPSSKTSQKKSSISSTKTYSRVSNKGQENRQKVPVRNRPPKAPPSERRRVPVKPKLKIKSKVGSTSPTKSTSPTTTTTTTTTDTTATAASPNTPSTSPATTTSIKDESTESTRTTRQMQDRITTIPGVSKVESELETTIRDKQHSSETTASVNQSSTTEEVLTTEQETMEPTTNDPTTTSVSGLESTIEVDSYTTVEEDTETATLLQAEFRDGAGPEIFDGSYESTYNSFDLYEKPIGGPSRHSETLTTAPGRTPETFSSYTSISSDAAPPSSLTANTPSLAEYTKEYESSTARSEFPLDFGDDFLSAAQDDGDLEIIMFEEEISADPEEPRPLSVKERIAQDYRPSTEGSDLTTISLAERIDQAVDVRITGSSGIYPKDEIDLALDETIAEDASLTAEHRDGVVTVEQEEVAENEENIGNIPPDPLHMRKPKGINACPVKGEIQSPYWANNTRGEVMALLNMYPFEQYIHMEKCVHENKQMYCRNGCRCEQQYRLHRLLAYDPTNECRGIFSDWFSFPSCCVCKCYNLHHNIFEGSSRRPRLESNPDDEYYDDEEYYYDDDVDEEEEEDEEYNEEEYINNGDYRIEDFNLEQFEHLDREVKTRRKSKAFAGSVPPSKIQPQRAPRPLGRPKSHIAPPGPSLPPPSPNLLPPPANNINKHQGRYEINTRDTVDTVTPTVYKNDSTWMRENGRALPLFRITRNAQESEEETPEKE